MLETRRPVFTWEQLRTIEELQAWRGDRSDVATTPTQRRALHNGYIDTDEEIANLLIESAYFAEKVTLMWKVLPSNNTIDGGAPISTESRMADIALIDTLVGRTGSLVAVYRMLGPTLWRSLRQRSMQQYGKGSRRALSRRIPDISTVKYWRKKMESDAWLTRWEHEQRAIARDTARRIGLLVEGTKTKTAFEPSDVVYGDGNNVSSKNTYPPGATVVDRRTGEVRERPCDSDGRSNSPSTATWQCHVSTYVRGEGRLERIVLDTQILSDGQSEMDAFVPMVEKAAEDPHSRVFIVAYDMAMHATQIAELFDLGIVSLVKVPRSSTGEIRRGSLGMQKFKLRGGGTRRVLVETADGSPFILGVADGAEYAVPLTFVKLHPRWPTLYVEYEVPDEPCIEESLRGAALWFPIRQRDPANRALFKHYRIFPECSEVFQDCFGRREDAESDNDEYQSKLPRGRARVYSRHGQQLDRLNYAACNNLRALAAYRHRTADPPDQVAA